MRRMPIPQPPASLSSAAAQRERTRLATFYADPANESARYPGTFNAYRHEQVRQALKAAFGGRCAYCETFYDATQPTAVEHFRPKGEVTIAGQRTPPGYWWLASKWENLLPSCTDCNSPRKQDFPAGLPATAGKANAFPLPTEKRRAHHDGEEKNERPLLLHPYFDDPEEHLEFVWGTGTVDDGQIRPRQVHGRESVRGRTTIEVCALQRLGLVANRRRHLIKLIAFLEVVAQRKAEAAKAPGDPDARKAFEDAVVAVRETFTDDDEYVAMTHQVIKAYFARLFGG
ncbi:hypothetical protein ABZX12_21785 [Kribbella sp. NPDC003505]|uniref:hypothetical protein n=1 Tax=Kribbella sp. NPDC003505 TaxID=3154448 RepID=UPI0033A089F8